METAISASGAAPRPNDESPIAWQRELPQCVEARAERNKWIWDAIEEAECNGKIEALFEEGIVAIAAQQLVTPVRESLWADPAAAEKIRDAMKKLNLAGRWDRAIRAHKAGERAERRAFQERHEALAANPTNPEPVEFEDTGETAIEWFSGLSPDPIWLAEMLSRMNAEHAVVPVSNGAVRYLQRTKDIHGNDDARFLRPDDFHRLYAHISFNVNGKRVTASQAWERWSHRKQYAGVGMFPGSDVCKPQCPRGYLNLWKGYAVRPIEGDWSKFRNHLFNKVCQGDDDHFYFLMDWLAHIIQRPQEKPGTCIVLKSAAEGTGKSILSKMMMRILGEHALSVSKPDQIVGRFNGHLAKTILLTCEEALWAGDRQAEGALKNLITEDTITVEQKGLDAYSAPNYTRLLMISNNEWVVPVGENPRRFFVLEVVNKRASDPKYFGPMMAQMEKGGIEAMLHELLHWEIDNDLRFAPATAALKDQRAQSLTGIERWLLDVAETGGVRDHREYSKGKRIWLNQEGATPISTDIVRDAAKQYCGPSDCRGVDRTLGQLLKKAGVERVRSRGKETTDGRGYFYEFPIASEFRASVAKALKVTVHDADKEAGHTIH